MKKFARLIRPLLLCAAFALATPPEIAGAAHVYFGTGGGGAKGIYRASFDSATGKLGEPALAAELGAPGFLAFHPDRRILYSVGRLEGKACVAAYQIAADGALGLLNVSSVDGDEGTHLAVHPSGKLLITAQYGAGTVGLFPLAPDGRVGERAQLLKHGAGSGVVKSRQEGPHPHWSGFSPDGRFAFVPDLGMDKIVIYAVDPEKPALAPNGFAEALPGAGPRHMRFSVDGRFIFLLNEMGESVTTFAYDPANGTAARLGTAPALSEAQLAKASLNAAAEILVHPNGRFVYASNRGHDSVTLFKADPQTGALAAVEAEPIRGAFPRNINLDSTGRWLLAAGQDSNTISVFAVNQETGELTFQRRSTINVPSPICILFGD